MDVSMGMDEVQSFGDAAKEFQPTIYEGSVSFAGKYNKADGGQGGLWAKLIAGTAITVDLITDGSHGGSGNGYTGTIYLEKISIKADVNSVETFDASGKFSGAISYSTTI